MCFFRKFLFLLNKMSNITRNNYMNLDFSSTYDNFRDALNTGKNEHKYRLSTDIKNELNNLLKVCLQKCFHCLNVTFQYGNVVNLKSHHIEACIMSCCSDPNNMDNDLANVLLSKARKIVAKFNSIDKKTRSRNSENKVPKLGTELHIFAPSTFKRLLKDNTLFNVVSMEAAVLLSAVVYYLAMDLMQKAAAFAFSTKKLTIDVRCITMAIQNDSHLRWMYSHTTTGGGVIRTSAKSKRAGLS